MARWHGPAIVIDAGGTNMKIGFQTRPGAPIANAIVVPNDVFRQEGRLFNAEVQRLLGIASIDVAPIQVAVQSRGASFEGAEPHAQQNFVALVKTFKSLFESRGGSAAPIFIATNNKEIFLPQGAEPNANHIFSIYGRVTEADLKSALHSQTESGVTVLRDEAALRGGMFLTAAREGIRSPFYVTFGTYMGGGMDTRRGAGLLEVDGDSTPVLSRLQTTELPWLLPARAIPTSYLARVTGQVLWPSEFEAVFSKMQSALDYDWRDFQSPSFPSLLHGELGESMFSDGHLDDEGHVTLTVEEIALRASAGDTRALAVFNDFGIAAGHILGHAAKLKEADGIVLAGGIAQAEQFFLSALQGSMSEIVEIPVAIVESPRWAVLSGTAEIGRQQLMVADRLVSQEAVTLNQ